jgi:hypothetical protein
VGGGRGNQPEDSFGDFLRPSGAADRHTRRKACETLRNLKLKIGIDEAGADSIDPDTFGRNFER